MSTIDIRINEETPPVNKIVFAEKRGLWRDATCLLKTSTGGCLKGFTISVEGREMPVVVPTREAVDNLIKALEKAKELGWV